jgi:hypothetical protein
MQIRPHLPLLHLLVHSVVKQPKDRLNEQQREDDESDNRMVSRRRVFQLRPLLAPHSITVCEKKGELTSPPAGVLITVTR